MTWQQRATTEGIALKGSFYWSAMDNFGWRKAQLLQPLPVGERHLHAQV